MKNMISQVKNCKVFVLCALFLVALMGCKNSDPFVDPGDTPNPNWVITVENNMPSSLTAIVKVSFAKNEGVLAAFMGNDCCGIAEYKDGLYWLYVSPASETGGAVQLRFYSPDLKRIFEATEIIPYSNNAMIGEVEEPYTPTWVVK